MMQHTKEVLIGVGITMAIAVIAGSVMGASSISQAQSESLEIKTVELKKGSYGTALLSVEIKNAGNSPLGSITGQLNFDTDDSTAIIDAFTFTSVDLSPGVTTVFVGDITGSSSMSVGESYTLFVNGTTLQGTTIYDTAVVSVSRF